MASKAFPASTLCSVSCSQQATCPSIGLAGRYVRPGMIVKAVKTNNRDFSKSKFCSKSLCLQTNVNSEELRRRVQSYDCGKAKPERSMNRFEVRAKAGGTEPGGDPNSKAILDAFFFRKGSCRDYQRTAWKGRWRIHQ